MARIGKRKYAERRYVCHANDLNFCDYNSPQCNACNVAKEFQAKGGDIQ